MTTAASNTLPLNLASRVVLLAILAGATFRAVRVAWADLEYRKATPASIARAEQLVPSDASYHYMAALALEQNNPSSPDITREFAAAVSDNPRDSDALLAWSVDREIHGDKAGAEQLLLDARRTDHLLRPEWALANFYFRQGDMNRFLAGARESLHIIGETGLSEGRFDPIPIFELCWKSGATATEILNRAMPPEGPVLYQYLGFLLATSRFAAANELAAKILPQADLGEMAFIRPYLNLVVSRNEMNVAMNAWHDLYHQAIVPYDGPDPAKNIYLTDGELLGPPLNFGLDWWRLTPDSVQFTFSNLEHTFRFDFDGSEPDDFVALAQTVPLQPGKQYRLTARFRSDLDPEPLGFSWNLIDHKSAQPISGTKSVSAKVRSLVEEDRTFTLDFATASNTDSADLRLAYKRSLGTEHLRGYYELVHAELKQQPK